MHTCNFCGIETEEINIVDGYKVCDACLMNDMYFVRCDICHDFVHRDKTSVIENHTICPECVDEYTGICVQCGTHILTQNSQVWAGERYCSTCFDNNFAECSRCGCVAPVDALENGLCDSCIETMEREARGLYIHEYQYKPVLNFYGNDDNIFMGFELESGGMDTCEELDELVENLLDLFGTYQFCFKSDGSIPDYGAELVSQPMTLKYHKEEAKWKEILFRMSSAGLRSSDISNCGLHVHVSRKCLKPIEWIKIDAFVNIYKTFMEAVSGRDESHYAKYKKVNKVCSDSEELGDRYYSRNRDRYVALNFQNKNTVEFRMFKGTLKYTTFIARLEFVHAIVSYAKKLRCYKLSSGTREELDNFLKFLVKNKDKYSNIIEWIKNRYSNSIIA